MKLITEILNEGVNIIEKYGFMFFFFCLINWFLFALAGFANTFSKFLGLVIVASIFWVILLNGMKKENDKN